MMRRTSCRSTSLPAIAYRSRFHPELMTPSLVDDDRRIAFLLLLLREERGQVALQRLRRQRHAARQIEPDRILAGVLVVYRHGVHVVAADHRPPRIIAMAIVAVHELEQHGRVAARRR